MKKIFKIIFLIIILVIVLCIICLIYNCVRKNIREKMDKKEYDRFVSSYTKRIFNNNFKKDYNNIGYIKEKNNLNQILLVTCYHGLDVFKIISEAIENNPKCNIIILDGEPKNLEKLDKFKDNIRVIITTKKEFLPKKIPNIYNPYYVFSFLNEIKGKNYSLLLNKPKFTKTKFCAFMYSNCDEFFKGVRNRKKFYKLFQKISGNRVDNLGKCYNNNYDTNKSTYADDNFDILKDYKFNISFENSSIKGYVSEKLVIPMLVSCIPIYLGAPDVLDHFNNKSFINVRDFNSFEDCIKFILYVDSNDNLYNTILNEPWLFQNRFNEYFSLLTGGKFYKQLYNYFPDIVNIYDMFEQNIIFVSFTNHLLQKAKESTYFREIFVYDTKEYNIKLKILLDKLNLLKNNDFLIFWNSEIPIIEDSKLIIEYYNKLSNSQSGLVIFKDYSNDIIMFKKNNNTINLLNIDLVRNKPLT